MTRAAAVATALLLAATIACCQTQPVFQADFDEGFDAIGPAGVIVATPEEAPELVAGRSGQGLKSGPGTGYLLYPTEGVVSTKAGTIEMWVQALDWTPAEAKFHVFFDVRGQGQLHLYKYYQTRSLLMLTSDDRGGPYFSSPSAMNWQPGEWHHIAGTWSPEGVLSYIDGKPATPVPTMGELPISLGETFQIGDHPWQFERTSSSVLDDVRIYDRALSPAHLAAHFAGDYDFVATLSEQTVVLRHRLDVDAMQIPVTISTAADVPDERITARVALVPKGRELPADAATVRFEGGYASHALQLPSLEPGEFEVAAAIYDGDALAVELRRPFVIPVIDWRDNTIGEEDKILRPWTPLEAANGVVSCWGREYTLADGGLPAQMTSAGEELLAGPVLVRAKSGDTEVVWTGGERRDLLSDARTRLTVNGEMTGTVGDAAARLTVESWTEYDGLMYLTLSVPEGGALPVDTLSIEIPVDIDRAMYRHRWARTYEGVTGNLPEGEGVVDSSGFLPYYWLGDNDRGLFWFCESDQYWPNGRAANAVEIERQGDRIVLRLNILAPGQTLPEGWRFSFGLQATPVKPIPADWRKWRMRPGLNGNVEIIWPRPDADSMRYFGYPQASDPDLYQKRIDGMHENGIAAVPYLCLTYLSVGCPEWALFESRWCMGGTVLPSDVAQYGDGFAMVSPLGEGFADFIIARTRQFVDRYGIDGLYHDNTHPYASKRIGTGVGYERDGGFFATHPILAYRDLYRRAYAFMKDLPRETFTMAHMSARITIPILGFDESYLDGEHFRGRVQDCYLDVVSLDTFRAEFMGRQWGIMPYFLPEFQPPYNTQAEPARGLMALLMMHDIAPWPLRCNIGEINRALAALDEFGYVHAQFVGYFDDPAPATISVPDLHASAYLKDGRALLIVANPGREPQAGTVTVNPAALGLGEVSARSWPEGEALGLTGNAFEVSLEGLDWRMVLLTER